MISDNLLKFDTILFCRLILREKFIPIGALQLFVSLVVLKFFRVNDSIILSKGKVFLCFISLLFIASETARFYLSTISTQGINERAFACRKTSNQLRNWKCCYCWVWSACQNLFKSNANLKIWKTYSVIYYSWFLTTNWIWNFN